MSRLLLGTARSSEKCHNRTSLIDPSVAALAPLPIPSDSVLAPLYVGADLLDAFAIHLPVGASDDPEVLARVAFERARHAGTSHLNSSNFPPALLSIASQ